MLDYNNKREELKRTALKDIDHIKHEYRYFQPNPNKQKVFEFKNDSGVEPSVLDERSLINPGSEMRPVLDGKHIG